MTFEVVEEVSYANGSKVLVFGTTTIAGRTGARTRGRGTDGPDCRQ